MIDNRGLIGAQRLADIAHGYAEHSVRKLAPASRRVPGHAGLVAGLGGHWPTQDVGPEPDQRKASRSPVARPHASLLQLAACQRRFEINPLTHVE